MHTRIRSSNPITALLARNPDSPETPDGFTLIEVLIATLLLVLVVGALTTATFVGLKIASSSGGSEKGSGGELNTSTDAQFASASFGRDVRGAFYVNNPIVTNTTLCPVDPALASGSDLVDFSVDTTGLGQATVSYQYGNVGSHGWMVRCAIGGSNGGTVYTPIARNLAKSTPPLVTVSCGGSACSNGSVVTSVTVSGITEVDGDTYALKADPRASTFGTPASNGGGIIPAVLVTGATPSLSIANNVKVNVIGNLVINSNQPNALSLGGPNTAGTPCESGHPWICVSGARYAPFIDMLPGATCSGCTTNNIFPLPIGTIPSAIPDPYATLAAPGKKGCDPTSPSYPNDNCKLNPIPMSVGGTTTYYPGVYSSQVSLANNSTDVLEPGTYVFESGISLGNNSSTSTPLPPAVPTAEAGVFWYIGCDTAVDASCTTAQEESAAITSMHAGLNLVPPTSGTYVGMSIFEARDDTQPIALDAGSGSQEVGGVIYAPDASITASGNSSWTFKQLVTQQVSLQVATVTLEP